MNVRNQPIRLSCKRSSTAFVDEDIFVSGCSMYSIADAVYIHFSGVYIS